MTVRHVSFHFCSKRINYKNQRSFFFFLPPYETDNNRREADIYLSRLWNLLWGQMEFTSTKSFLDAHGNVGYICLFPVTQGTSTMQASGRSAEEHYALLRGMVFSPPIAQLSTLSMCEAGKELLIRNSIISYNQIQSFATLHLSIFDNHCICTVIFSF